MENHDSQFFTPMAESHRKASLAYKFECNCNLKFLNENMSGDEIPCFYVLRCGRSRPHEGKIKNSSRAWLYLSALEEAELLETDRRRERFFMLQSPCLALATVISLWTATVFAQQAPLTTRQQLTERLQRQVSVTWQGQELGRALNRLAASQQIVLWLDRRVDPRQSVDIQLTDVPLQQALEETAQHYGLGVARLDRIVYVGPAKSAREVATLSQRAHDSLDGVPEANKRQWLQTKPLRWPRLSEPRALLTELLAEDHIQLLGSQRIAHDLWPAKKLPPLPLVDRVVLILLGFDLTCEIGPDGRTCTVAAIQRPVVLSRQYKLSGNQRKLLARIAREVPQAQLKVNDQTLTAVGRWEDQLQLRRLLSAPGPISASGRPRARGKKDSQQVYSLRLRNQPVGRVMDQLAAQLKLKVVWNDQQLAAAKRSRKTPVSCDVHEVDLDELLQSILAPAGMQYRRNGRQVEIEAAP